MPVYHITTRLHAYFMQILPLPLFYCKIDLVSEVLL